MQANAQHNTGWYQWRDALRVAGNGQYNVHERALTQVVTAVLAESFGQSEIYLARPVTDSFEQAHMHTVPTT